MTRLLLTVGLTVGLLALRLTAPARHRWGRATAHASDTLARASRPSGERGSVTIEQVIFAVAMIAVATIVVGAITGFVRSKAGQIN